MKTASLSQTRRSDPGMGTVELVFALMAIFFCCSWAVGWVKSRFEDRWTEDKLHDLAAEIVAVTEAASLAGIDLVDRQGVSYTLDRIESGATADAGPFRGQSYRVDGLTEDAKIRVADHLRIHLGKLETIPPKCGS